MIGVVYLREENYSNERKNGTRIGKNEKKKESISYLYLIHSASAF